MSSSLLFALQCRLLKGKLHCRGIFHSVLKHRYKNNASTLFVQKTFKFSIFCQRNWPPHSLVLVHTHASGCVSVMILSLPSFYQSACPNSVRTHIHVRSSSATFGRKSPDHRQQDVWTICLYVCYRGFEPLRARSKQKKGKNAFEREDFFLSSLSATICREGKIVLSSRSHLRKNGPDWRYIFIVGACTHKIASVKLEFRAFWWYHR